MGVVGWLVGAACAVLGVQQSMPNRPSSPAVLMICCQWGQVPKGIDKSLLVTGSLAKDFAPTSKDALFFSSVSLWENSDGLVEGIVSTRAVVHIK